MRLIVVRSGIAVGLALPALVFGALAAELSFRRLGPALLAPDQPCLRASKELHHEYTPGCFARFAWPEQSIEYRFNEDGLRDRPRAEFRNGAVLVLGDSFVKGLGLPEEDTLSRVLERKVASREELRFLNGGIRATGPVLQSLHAARALISYPVRGVVWVIGPGEAIDDVFTRLSTDRLGPQGIPVSFVPSERPLDGWGELSRRILEWNQRRSVLLEFVGRNVTPLGWRKLTRNPDPALLCAGFSFLGGRLRSARIPGLLVFVPRPISRVEGYLLGANTEARTRAVQLTCAREAGFEVLDLSGDRLPEDFYLADQRHLSSSGAEWLSGRIAPEIARKLLE